MKDFQGMNYKLLICCLVALVVPRAIYADDSNLQRANNVIFCAPSKAAYDDSNQSIGAEAYPLDGVVIGIKQPAGTHHGGSYTESGGETTWNYEYNGGKVVFTILDSSDTTNKKGTVAVGGSYSYSSDKSTIAADLLPNFIVGDKSPGVFDAEEFKGVTSITIPSRIKVATGTWEGWEFTVVAISSECFAEIKWEGSIKLPSTLKTIGQNAFNTGTYNVFELSAIEYYNAPNGAADVNTTGDVYNNVTTFAEKAFAYTGGLTSVSLQSAVSIGSNCFYDCKDLQSVTLPSTLETIGSYAFHRCTALTTADLSAATQITALPAQMFYQCSSLSNVTLPSTLKSIGYKCFQQCNFTSLPELPSGFETFGEDCFADNNITSMDNLYTVESSLKKISGNAFYRNRINYLKLKPANNYGEGFVIEHWAFADQKSEFIVDLLDCPEVPSYLDGAYKAFAIDERGYKIGDQTYASCLRVIVPINCVEAYANGHTAMSTIKWTDYRVKFDWALSSTYLDGDLATTMGKELENRAYYQYYNITPQQRLVATSAWKNDYLNFRPQRVTGTGTDILANQGTFYDSDD